MPRFHYTALRSSGDAIAGDLDADSRPVAIAELAKTGLFVTEIERGDHSESDRESPAEAGAAGAIWKGLLTRRRTLTPRSRAAMLRQLAVALQSGLTLLSALRVVQEQAESTALAEVCRDLAQRVQGGESLSDAMEARVEQFSQLEVAMVRVGETAGVLDETVGYLADFAQRDLEVREKINSAAAYPLFVLVLAGLSVIIIMTWILPSIMSTVLGDADPATLPLPTRLVMAISGWMSSWYGLITLLVLIFAGGLLRNWMKTPGGRLAFDSLKLRTPVLGPALRKIAVGRFARTLGTLTRSGIQIIEAMHVIRGTLGNEMLAQQIDRVSTQISEGKSIAEPLRQTGQFPPLLTQVIAMGERTGKLDVLLLQTADSYERETAAALGRVMTILPAVFIVLLALLVGFILAAVLLPIVSMDMGMGGF